MVHVLIVFRVLLMLPKWAYIEPGPERCNKFQRTPDEFIAFRWVQVTVWSTSIHHRFESRSYSSPCRYGSWGDRTHRRSKSWWPRLREIRSPVASSRCINSEIALPTIWLDDVVLSPWTRTLIRCWLFSHLDKMWMFIYVSHSLERPISIENDMLKSTSIFLNQ
jgi:hypothetical protein